MNMQTTMKELRILKQEELTMVNLASKISDQLNRLKVEELALQNMVRVQNEELERKSRGSQRSINRSLPLEELSKGGESDSEYEVGGESKSSGENVIPVNLVVNQFHSGLMEAMEEEEEEDDNDGEKGNKGHDDIEQFLKGLD